MLELTYGNLMLFWHMWILKEMSGSLKEKLSEAGLGLYCESLPNQMKELLTIYSKETTTPKDQIPVWLPEDLVWSDLSFWAPQIWALPGDRLLHISLILNSVAVAAKLGTGSYSVLEWISNFVLLFTHLLLQEWFQKQHSLIAQG